MISKRHKILSAIVALLILTCMIVVNASVLGSSQISGYTVKIGDGTYLTHGVYYSDQNGVGKQTENYITYTPNKNISPIITNGSSIYGRKNIYDAIDDLNNNGVNTLGGINADYFSLQTGVPMSNAIMDGKIITKDSSGQDAIGFMEDGTAFISWMQLTSTLVAGDKAIPIYNINKYRQPYAIYMFTDEFASTTKATTRGLDVILGSVEGNISINDSITAVVEDINIHDSEIAIPSGKIVLTVDCNAPSELYDPLSQLQLGEKITISFGAYGDDRWDKVKTAMGAVGGRLLTGGEINPYLEAGAAPRTAIGVKENGDIVFYTIDGRQTGYSYGVQLKTLANRLKELGCVDAVNLDGGGSTSIVTLFPGDSSFSLVNKPSDRSVRAVSNFFFLKNNAAPTWELGNLTIYPLELKMLIGSSYKLDVKATDTEFYYMPLPKTPEFSVGNGLKSTITSDGVFTAKDNGTVTVKAKIGDIVGSLAITCLDTPTDIIIKNQASQTEISDLNIEKGSAYDLTADAYGGLYKLYSQDEAFRWEVEGNIGTIDDKGTFTASNISGATGRIKVSAGQTTKYVNVKIGEGDIYADENNFSQIDMWIEDNILYGSINCGYKIPTTRDGIILKIDGKKVDFDFDESLQRLTYTLPNSFENKAHKIAVFMTNTMGYTTMGKLSAKDNMAYENPFSDTSNNWAKDILSYMYNHGIINGELDSNKNRKFNPQKEMTRAEFAVMVSNYLGINADEYSGLHLPYADINSIPSWAINQFKALYKLGILTGSYVDENTVCAKPLDIINRSEAVTIIARTLPSGFQPIDITAPDKNDIPNWAMESFKVLIKLGAVNGYEDGRILPIKSLTKAEAAKILYSTF